MFTVEFRGQPVEMEHDGYLPLCKDGHDIAV